MPKLWGKFFPTSSLRQPIQFFKNLCMVYKTFARYREGGKKLWELLLVGKVKHILEYDRKPLPNLCPYGLTSTPWKRNLSTNWHNTRFSEYSVIYSNILQMTSPTVWATQARILTFSFSFPPFIRIMTCILGLTNTLISNFEFKI